MKPFFRIILFFLFTNLLQSQTFYNSNTIQDIRIVFSQSNWDALLDAEAAGAGNYIAAQSVSINGTVFYTVGVKYKGNSSYNPNNNKNPFHIELDTYSNQDYQGYTDIKLSNVIYDPSFVRETTAFSIARQYMDAPMSNYANVYVNGVLRGLYINTESISKKFVSNYFYSNTNAFFSCSPPAGASPLSTNLPSLAYLGNLSTSYETAYEIKSLAGWDDLINLTNVLNNSPSNIESVLDVDRALWMLAFDNALVNLDSYIGKFKQNYYLYKDNNGRFNPIVWDLNMAFGTFSDTGTLNLTSTTAKKQLTHLLHTTDTGWPLITKLLEIPRYKKIYLAHYATIISENLSNASYLTTANSFQSLISSSVQADPFKFYTFAQFQSNIGTTDTTLGMNTAPGISGLMSGRNTYLTGLSDFTNTKPTISNIALSVQNPLLNSTVSVSANIINTNTNAVFLGYRANKTLPFTKIQMFDDGTHNDGAANDNQYGVSIPITTVFTQYYIYAENNNIGRFSPERAEHEFYTINASYPKIQAGQLKINEIMAQNTSTVTDDNGEYEDWIELYNTTSSTLSLDNLYMTDTSTNLLKWEFPAGLTIPPYGYLTVWADQDLTQTGLHADFKLSTAGESAILSYPDGTTIETVNFGAQTPDLGYARIPNGTGNFVIQAPTYNGNNQPLSVDDFDADLDKNLKVYPNPTQDFVVLLNEKNPIEKIEIYNLQGQLLYKENNIYQNQIRVDFSNFSNGIYLLTVNNNSKIKIVRN
jgi:hypothetical protein